MFTDVQVNDAGGTFSTKAEQQLGRLRAELDYTSIQDLIDRGLHEYVDHFQSQLNRVGEAIFEDFFAVKPIHVARQMTALSGMSGRMRMVSV